MKHKLSSGKLILIGIVLYTPCFIWQFYAGLEAVPLWFFLCSAIPAGLCLVIGLLWLRFKKESPLDDSLEETMRERNNYR